MTVRERNIQLPLAEIRAICERHPIAKLSLFGSVLREDFRANSDVDMLVELVPDSGVGLFEFMDIKFALQDLIGRDVDLRTIQEFPERMQTHVLDTAEAVYVRQL